MLPRSSKPGRGHGEHMTVESTRGDTWRRITRKAEATYLRGTLAGCTTGQIQAEIYSACPELHPLEARRLALGWPRRRVLDAITVIQSGNGLRSPLRESDLFEWERRRRVPRDYIDVLCRVLRCRAADIGYPEFAADHRDLHPADHPRPERHRRLDPPGYHEHEPASLTAPNGFAAESDRGGRRRTAVSSGLSDGEAVIVVPMLFADGRVEHMAIPRRAFLGAGAAALGATLTGRFTADDLDRIDLAIQTPERVDLPIVGYFATILADHRRADDLLGSQHLRLPVLVQLAMIRRFITAAKDPTVRRELQRVGAQYAQFAWWLALDVGDRHGAAEHFERARGWALDAGDYPLVGYVYAASAAFAHDPAEARWAADAAQRAEYQQQATPAVRAHTAIRVAPVRAAAGELAACERELHQARDLLAERSREQEPPWIYWLQEVSVPFYLGVCYDQAGRADLATARFAEALHLLPGDWTRDRGEFLARRAGAHAASGEPERAVADATEALSLIQQTGSTRNLACLRTAAHRLQRWRELPSVRDFLGQLRADVPT